MTDERVRGVKVLTLKTIKCDPEVNALDGPNPKKIAKGEVVVLPPLLAEHYQRHKCITKDLPLEA
ncbi:MAG: hypothetical protein ACN2B6_00795 [Rickettsiales bacterium]